MAVASKIRKLERPSRTGGRQLAGQPAQSEPLLHLALDYDCAPVGQSLIVHADCFEWLGRIPENGLHAVITDPPYGVKEYNFDQIEKRTNGNGGIWRIPPSFDGHTRAPLPRFTALSPNERETLYRFFLEWSRLVLHALRPGGHIFIASNAFLSLNLYFLRLSKAAWNSAASSFAWCARCVVATGPRTLKQSSLRFPRCPADAMNRGGFCASHFRRG